MSLTSPTENVSRSTFPRKPSVITSNVFDAHSTPQPQEINYREEVILLFLNSLLGHVVEEYTVTSGDDHAETHEAEKTSPTEVKDFRDLSREDLQKSQISNISGSKVSLSKISKRSSESRDSIKSRRRSKQSQDKEKRSFLSATKTDLSLKRPITPKSGRRVSAVTSFSTIEEDTGVTNANDWFVRGSAEEVIINFKNGNTYKGSVLKKRLHGYGTFTWADGTVYEGEFKNGHLSGKGKLEYNDNSYYLGDFCNGLLHGEGCMYVSSTSMLYSGKWKGGKKNVKICRRVSAMKKKSPVKFEDVAKLVVNTLRDLREYRGSSVATIKNHLVQNYDPTPSVLNRVPGVLKKGVAFGAIRKNQGHYKLDSIMALAVRQHRRRRKKNGNGARKKRRRRRRRPTV